jgi:light-harvesting complex I chlorophyll a/b binding protein 4
MHFVELKRWQDWRNPGSVDQDPLFPNNKLPPHEVRSKEGSAAPWRARELPTPP